MVKLVVCLFITKYSVLHFYYNCRYAPQHVFNLFSDSSPTDIASNQQYTVKRKLEVRQISTNEKRVVTQYHYQKWPDFGVPEGKEVNNFLKLVSLVAQENPSTEGKLWLIS